MHLPAPGRPEEVADTGVARLLDHAAHRQPLAAGRVDDAAGPQPGAECERQREPVRAEVGHFAVGADPHVIAERRGEIAAVERHDTVGKSDDAGPRSLGSVIDRTGRQTLVGETARIKPACRQRLFDPTDSPAQLGVRAGGEHHPPQQGALAAVQRRAHWPAPFFRQRPGPRQPGAIGQHPSQPHIAVGIDRHRADAVTRRTGRTRLGREVNGIGAG